MMNDKVKQTDSDNMDCKSDSTNNNLEEANQSVGYTPLTTNNNASMLMMMMMPPEEEALNDDNNDNNLNMMFTLGPPPPSNNDDGDEWDFNDYDNTNDDDNDDVDCNNEHQGAFYTNFNNFIISSHEDEHSVENDIGNNNDYKAIAEKALQNLMYDYNATITSVRTTNCNDYNDDNNNNDNYEPIVDCNKDDESPIYSSKNNDQDANVDHNEFNHIPEVSNNNHNHNCDNNPTILSSSSSFEANFDEINFNTIPSHSTSSKSYNTNTNNNNLDKDITLNKDAISKAMNNIRLKASTSLITKLDEGVNQGVVKTRYPVVNVPKDHTIIPPKQLLAFRRGNTLKSIEATSILTRSATLAEGIVRFIEFNMIDKQAKQSNEQLIFSSFNNAVTKSQDTFIIHIIGADDVECKSKETIQQAIEPFVHWWQKSFSGGVTTNMNNELESPIVKFISTFEHLRIEFLGPNVSLEAHNRQPVLLYPSATASSSRSQNVNNRSRGLKTATAICRNCLYHDYLEKIKTKDKKKNDISGDNTYCFPHIIIAYNAGVWGYDDWKPTLKSMKKILPHPTPFIITSYTIQEAEDDAEVVQDIVLLDQQNVQEDVRNFVIISPSTNPFGSRKVRETTTSPYCRPYFENGAWQLWLIGSST